MTRILLYSKGLALLTILSLFLGACSLRDTSPTSAPVTPSLEKSITSGPVNSPTPFQPSPTPAPLAAVVNGTGITLQEYQAELARYQAAVGTEVATQDKTNVLNDLIDQVLLAQAAAEKGFVVDDNLVQQHIDQLTNELGSTQALSDWMAAHGYVEADFRRDLARSIAATWMRDQITSAVPETADQVHARQILVSTSTQAQDILTQLKSGQDFAQLAAKEDPATGGDLGWFPRGYLPDQKLEEAAFSLQPDQFSDVIETSTGFHILQVIERDPQRTLTPDARLTLQTQALQNWLENQRKQSEIQVLLP
jgi:peptidyl-prolyl cis-trans isomerase C